MVLGARIGGFRLVGLLALASVCVGCSASYYAAPASTALIPSDYDRTWAALIETLTEMRLPIVSQDKDAGTIATGWTSLAGAVGADLANCGDAGLGPETDRIGKVSVFAKMVQGGVQVRILGQFQATGRTENDKWAVNCRSTGVLERRINEAVARKVTR